MVLRQLEALLLRLEARLLRLSGLPFPLTEVCAGCSVALDTSRVLACGLLLGMGVVGRVFVATDSPALAHAERRLAESKMLAFLNCSCWSILGAFCGAPSSSGSSLGW